MVQVQASIERDPNTHPLDSDFYRNRARRFYFLVAFGLIVPTIGLIIGIILGHVSFNNAMMSRITGFIGFGAGALVVISSLDRFLIKNNTTSMFVTINELSTLRGNSDVNIPYGPGTHICFPWERRLVDNNVSLKESAVTFVFTVQCEDGKINGKGTFLLRPDTRHIITYLTSVNAIDKEISNLIITQIVSYISDKKVMDTLKLVDELNKNLCGVFVEGQTEFERQYGISLTDLKVSELLPSEEVQRTLASLVEANVVAQGAALLAGYSSPEEARAAKAAGTLTTDSWKYYTDRFLTISGNMENMEIKRSEFAISLEGIDPEIVKAIQELANSPAAQAAVAATASRSANKSKPKKKPKKGK